MDDRDLEKRVLALIAESVPAKLKNTKVTPEARLQRDLGLDSLALLAVLFRFEQEFGIDLTALSEWVSLGQMRTVGDAMAAARNGRK